MKLKPSHVGKSFMKHLDMTPVSYSFNQFPDFRYLPTSFTLPSYPGLGMGVGYGPLKKGDIVGNPLTFYDPLNPSLNTTVDLSKITSGLTSGLSPILSNTVKIYSNSEITVNIVGTEADTTKGVKILDKIEK